MAFSKDLLIEKKISKLAEGGQKLLDILFCQITTIIKAQQQRPHILIYLQKRHSRSCSSHFEGLWVIYGMVWSIWNYWSQE